MADLELDGLIRTVEQQLGAAAVFDANCRASALVLRTTPV